MSSTTAKQNPRAFLARKCVPPASNRPTTNPRSRPRWVGIRQERRCCNPIRESESTLTDAESEATAWAPYSQLYETPAKYNFYIDDEMVYDEMIYDDREAVNFSWGSPLLLKQRFYGPEADKDECDVGFVAYISLDA